MLLFQNLTICLNPTNHLHGTFLPNIKYFGCKIEIQCNNTPLAVEQNNYTAKTVNAYIVYDLYDKNFRNFKLKNCLFEKDNDKSSYGIVFYRKGEWNFVTDSA